MDDRQITMGCPEGRMLKLQIDWHITGTSGGIFVIFYTILHESFIICNFSKCGGGGGGDGGGVKTWCRIEHLQHL